jgi:hypothetical protein
VATWNEARPQERGHNTPYEFVLVLYWQRALSGLFHPFVVEFFEMFHLFHPVKNE